MIQCMQNYAMHFKFCETEIYPFSVSSLLHCAGVFSWGTSSATEKLVSYMGRYIHALTLIECMLGMSELEILRLAESFLHVFN